MTEFKMLIINVFLLTLFVISIKAGDIIVNTNYGKVRGEKLSTFLDERDYYSFKGIPYAQPPIGDLRFKPPQKPKPWSDVLNAVEYGNVCVQGSFGEPPVFSGNEDCLFINVFSPDIKPKRKLPVIFGVHGGAFAFGYGEMLGPDFLMDEDVIFVTFNYRVGALGFLNFGTPEYSGNMGLKDQLAALKWTSENIDFFGGDKDSITIIGESAGGASIHYHLMSSQSKGLFNRAIVACGSAFNPWAFNNDPDHVQIIKDLGVRVNYPLYDYEDMVNFVKKFDATMLTKYTYQQFLNLDIPRQDIGMIWAPTVEHSATNDPFLLESPERIMNGNYKSDVDVMFTYASNEMMIAEIGLTDKIIDNLNTQFEIHLPLAEANINYNSKAYQEIATKIRKHYFSNDGTVHQSQRKNFIDLLSDVYFVYGIHRTIQIHASKSTGKTYNWIYSGIPEIGALHTEDTSYIFSRDSRWPIAPFYDDFSDEIVNIIKTLTSMVAEFARSGNPTPNRQPVNFKSVKTGTYNFLNITRTQFIPSVDPPKSKTFAFWDGIFEEYLGKKRMSPKNEL